MTIEHSLCISPSSIMGDCASISLAAYSNSIYNKKILSISTIGTPFENLPDFSKLTYPTKSAILIVLVMLGR